MGTLHRCHFKFTSLDGIREAYNAAFKGCRNVLAVLDDKSFNALAAVRNLLVHRAGIVDGEYLDKAKNAPLAPQLEVNSSLKIDGELVAKLVTPAINNSVKLLNVVDSRIATTT